MKQTIVFLGIICFLIPVFLSAQTATELEALLEIPAVTCAQAAMFVLGNAVENDAVDDPYQSAVSSGWLNNTEADEAITLDKLSFLMMKAFDIKGGLMYSLFPNPRYAYRTMTSRNFLQGITDPAMTISGDEFLLVLGRVLNEQGDDE
ncbi:MAG: hypothetical protein LBU66_08265 [Treponema sp.]|jgi:hypothetical protein|nr:hypothetical protein [Treponema sp.]